MTLLIILALFALGIAGLWWVCGIREDEKPRLRPFDDKNKGYLKFISPKKENKDAR